MLPVDEPGDHHPPYIGQDIPDRLAVHRCTVRQHRTYVPGVKVWCHRQAFLAQVLPIVLEDRGDFADCAAKRIITRSH
ncbi:hypothetical protein Sfulv_01020 [Streptomyces fulvorobeus]|uniref:Uncharacterized protein n=1 Tax=Streptomyces fulvorobeus TaxID=284028 RepID=A0A7J0BYJ6_9ACTN|nr:hypothetical protein Sfulv_01020 [Streptomyces fulvorobeus]